MHPVCEIAKALRDFDTCTLADALDHLGFQLHNRGFTRPGLHYFGPEGGVAVGYAATARVRVSEPPVTGHTYFRHTEWWEEVDGLPAPRIAVLEDMDSHPGSGACIGRIGASVFRALGCVGAITNGSVRETAQIAATGFAVSAGHLSPARAYAHLIAHSVPVEIFGLRIDPGDLLVADRHGVLSIPLEARQAIVGAANEVRSRKLAFMDYCESDRFSIESLESHLKELHL